MISRKIREHPPAFANKNRNYENSSPLVNKEQTRGNASKNYRYESDRGLNHRHSNSTTIIFQGQSSSLPSFSVLFSRPTAILQTVVCARVWIMMVNDSNHLNGPLWTNLRDFLHGITTQWTALQSIAELDYVRCRSTIGGINI